MPAKITIVMGVLLLVIAIVEFYFSYDSAESNPLWADGSSGDRAKLMTQATQFSTACQLLGTAFVVFALYEPPIILDDQ